MISALARWVRRWWPQAEAWIEARELEQRLAGGEAVLVADVRAPDEFEGPLGHIPGARNIPIDDVRERIEEFEPARRRPIVLVCKTDRRSATGAQLLRARGFLDVRVLRGGMVEWNQEGLTVERVLGD